MKKKSTAWCGWTLGLCLMMAGGSVMAQAQDEVAFEQHLASVIGTKAGARESASDGDVSSDEDDEEDEAESERDEDQDDEDKSADGEDVDDDSE